MRAVPLLAIVLGLLHGCLATAVSDALHRANSALSAYDYAGALDAFNSAVELDPSSYLVYFRRATAQQALGRTSAALADLESTIERNPGFVKAYLQRARIYLREGTLARARDEFKNLDKQLKKTRTHTGDEVEKLRARVTHALKLEKQLADAKAGDHNCITLATQLLDEAPNHVGARLRRADCEVAQGDADAALIDWSRAAILDPSPALHLRVAILSYYVLGTRDSQVQDGGLAQIKACLHSDPENKACFQAHKQLRRISKAINKARGFADSKSWKPVISALKGAKVGGPTIRDEVEEVIVNATKADGANAPLLPPGLGDATKHSELLLEIDTLYCTAFGFQKHFEQAMPFCDRVVERDHSNAAALAIKGEDLNRKGDYKAGNPYLERAAEASGNAPEYLRLLQKGRKLEKLASQKNYYKVLGVPRDADERTIKKAYRRLARENHPDKGGDEQKMTAINEAFGVLSNKELRAQYDQGHDPNDPSGGQGHAHAHAHGNPFAQFFQQAAFQQQFREQFARHFGHGNHFNF